MEVLKDSTRILIIQTAFIGDAILVLPMIQQLRKNNPDAIIDVITTPAASEIFQNSDSVNNVIIYDKRGKDKSFSGMLRLVKKIRSGSYTELYSPHRSFRTSLLVLFSNVKNTYGFSNSAFPYVYKHVIDYEHSSHEVKRNLSLAGMETKDDTWKILPELVSCERYKKKIDNFLKTPGRYIAIAPGSVWETKKYPKEYYKEIIDYLILQDFTILLIGGLSDKEYCQKLCDNYAQTKIINTAGQFSIPESIELIKRCELLISNDSAPTHFGMCAHKPVLTIYCSTIPGFGFYPYSEKSQFISYNDLDCKPCGIHGHKRCPIGSFDCAKKIEIHNIKTLIGKMLSE